VAQSQFGFGQALALVPRRRVILDSGAIGRGSSGAHLVVADDGHEYIIKGGSYSLDHPYLAANELICANLARLLDLPILPFCIIKWGHDLYFGSRWLDVQTYQPFSTTGTLAGVDNIERLYDLVMFDTWVINNDRQGDNLFIVESEDYLGTKRRSMFAIDQGHCLLPPGRSPEELSQYEIAPVRESLFLDAVREGMVSRTSFDEALGRLLAVPFEEIAAAVHSVPEEWMSSSDRFRVAAFLYARRAFLKTQFVTPAADVFPNLVRAK
jgi:hypothetical protein